MVAQHFKDGSIHCALALNSLRNDPAFELIASFQFRGSLAFPCRRCKDLVKFRIG